MSGIRISSLAKVQQVLRSLHVWKAQLSVINWKQHADLSHFTLAKRSLWGVTVNLVMECPTVHRTVATVSLAKMDALTYQLNWSLERFFEITQSFWNSKCCKFVIVFLLRGLYMVIIADFSKFIIMPWPLLFHSSTSEFILKWKLNNANIVQNRPYKAKPISFGAL